MCLKFLILYLLINYTTALNAFKVYVRETFSDLLVAKLHLTLGLPSTQRLNVCAVDRSIAHGQLPMTQEVFTFLSKRGVLVTGNRMCFFGVVLHMYCSINVHKQSTCESNLLTFSFLWFDCSSLLHSGISSDSTCFMI